LDDAVFGVKPNKKLVQSVVRLQRSQSFVPYAHTKTRGEIRGGGRKPWKQKGTGNARQGSIRAPQWRKGGIVFGPRNTKTMNVKINAKERRQAIRMVLSDKAAEQHIVVIESFNDFTGKTKQIATLLQQLPVKTHSALIAAAKKNEPLYRAAKNIEKTNTVLADSVNVIDLMKFQYLVLDQASLESLVIHFK